jgi:hypothetical protein
LFSPWNGAIRILLRPGFSQSPNLGAADAQGLGLSDDGWVFAFLYGAQQTGQTKGRMMQHGKGEIGAIIAKNRQWFFSLQTLPLFYATWVIRLQVEKLKNPRGFF